MFRGSTLPRKLAATAVLSWLVLSATTALPAEAATSGVLPTTTTVSPSATQTAYGSPVTFSSTVALLGTGLVVIPTGTVTYTATSASGTQTLGTSSLSGCVLAPCTTSFTTSALAPGANTVTASYSGNGPTLITTTGVGSGNTTNTVVLVAPSSATTNVFVTKPPSAPLNLVASAGDGKNTLTWSPPSDPGSSPVTSYTINRKTGSGSYGYLATVNAPTTTYVDSTAANGTSYTYLVAANNSAGASTPSNPASATPQAAATAPSAPVLTGSGQVASTQLHWSSASNGGSAISEYRLYRSVSGQNSYTLIADHLPTGDYQDTTVVIGATYDYQATSVNAIGESGRSNTVTLTASALAPGSSQVQSCPAGAPCSSATATATDPQTGNNTDSTISVESSSSPHTATVAVGGPKLTGCTTAAAVGLSSTFNDTSTDAYKTVHWILNGNDANVWWYANNPTPASGELCLGLGSQWFNGQGAPVTWVAADGLWEGRVPACANNGLYYVGGGHYSQPCYTSIAYQVSGSSPAVFYKLDFAVQLPPGDGKISGGH